VNGAPTRSDTIVRVRSFLATMPTGSGHEIARGWVDAVLGEAVPVEAWLDGSWEDRLTEFLSGTPAPGMRGVLRLLLRGRPSARHQAAIAEVISWYAGLWEVVTGLAGSSDWRGAVVAQLQDYALGNRVSTFRPYYEDLAVPAERFAEWVEGIQDDFDGVLWNPHRWRTPFWEFRAMVDDIAVPWSSKCTCGGSWYLVLGDTGHRRFDQSSCSLCVGVNELGCGKTIVDVRD
jgi:hypothetical protein